MYYNLFTTVTHVPHINITYNTARDSSVGIALLIANFVAMEQIKRDISRVITIRSNSNHSEVVLLHKLLLLIIMLL